MDLTDWDMLWGCSDEAGDNNQEQHMNVDINDEDYEDDPFYQQIKIVV